MNRTLIIWFSGDTSDEEREYNDLKAKGFSPEKPKRIGRRQQQQKEAEEDIPDGDDIPDDIPDLDVPPHDDQVYQVLIDQTKRSLFGRKRPLKDKQPSVESAKVINFK